MKSFVSPFFLDAKGFNRFFLVNQRLDIPISFFAVWERSYAMVSNP